MSAPRSAVGGIPQAHDDVGGARAPGTQDRAERIRTKDVRVLLEDIDASRDLKNWVRQRGATEEAEETLKKAMLNALAANEDFTEYDVLMEAWKLYVDETRHTIPSTIPGVSKENEKAIRTIKGLDDEGKTKEVAEAEKIAAMKLFYHYHFDHDATKAKLDDLMDEKTVSGSKKHPKLTDQFRTDITTFKDRTGIAGDISQRGMISVYLAALAGGEDLAPPPIPMPKETPVQGLKDLETQIGNTKTAVGRQLYYAGKTKIDNLTNERLRNNCRDRIAEVDRSIEDGEAQSFGVYPEFTKMKADWQLWKSAVGAEAKVTPDAELERQRSQFVTDAGNLHTLSTNLKTYVSLYQRELDDITKGADGPKDGDYSKTADTVKALRARLNKVETYITDLITELGKGKALLDRASTAAAAVPPLVDGSLASQAGQDVASIRSSGVALRTALKGIPAISIKINNLETLARTAQRPAPRVAPAPKPPVSAPAPPTATEEDEVIADVDEANVGVMGPSVAPETELPSEEEEVVGEVPEGSVGGIAAPEPAAAPTKDMTDLMEQVSRNFKAVTRSQQMIEDAEKGNAEKGFDKSKELAAIRALIAEQQRSILQLKSAVGVDEKLLKTYVDKLQLLEDTHPEWFLEVGVISKDGAVWLNDKMSGLIAGQSTDDTIFKDKQNSREVVLSLSATSPSNMFFTGQDWTVLSRTKEALEYDVGTPGAAPSVNATVEFWTALVHLRKAMEADSLKRGTPQFAAVDGIIKDIRKQLPNYITAKPEASPEERLREQHELQERLAEIERSIETLKASGPAADSAELGAKRAAVQEIKMNIETLEKTPGVGPDIIKHINQVLDEFKAARPELFPDTVEYYAYGLPVGVVNQKGELWLVGEDFKDTHKNRLALLLDGKEYENSPESVTSMVAAHRGSPFRPADQNTLEKFKSALVAQHQIHSDLPDAPYKVTVTPEVWAALKRYEAGLETMQHRGPVQKGLLASVLRLLPTYVEEEGKLSAEAGATMAGLRAELDKLGVQRDQLALESDSARDGIAEQLEGLRKRLDKEVDPPISAAEAEKILIPNLENSQRQHVEDILSQIEGEGNIPAKVRGLLEQAESLPGRRIGITDFRTVAAEIIDSLETKRTIEVDGKPTTVQGVALDLKDSRSKIDTMLGRLQQIMRTPVAPAIAPEAPVAAAPTVVVLPAPPAPEAPAAPEAQKELPADEIVNGQINQLETEISRMAGLLDPASENSPAQTRLKGWENITGGSQANPIEAYSIPEDASLAPELWSKLADGFEAAAQSLTKSLEGSSAAVSNADMTIGAFQGVELEEGTPAKLLIDKRKEFDARKADINKFAELLSSDAKLFRERVLRAKAREEGVAIDDLMDVAEAFGSEANGLKSAVESIETRLNAELSRIEEGYADKDKPMTKKDAAAMISSLAWVSEHLDGSLPGSISKKADTLANNVSKLKGEAVNAIGTPERQEAFTKLITSTQQTIGSVRQIADRLKSALDTTTAKLGTVQDVVAPTKAVVTTEEQQAELDTIFRKAFAREPQQQVDRLRSDLAALAGEEEAAQKTIEQLTQSIRTSLADLKGRKEIADAPKDINRATLGTVLKELKRAADSAKKGERKRALVSARDDLIDWQKQLMTATSELLSLRETNEKKRARTGRAIDKAERDLSAAVAQKRADFHIAGAITPEILAAELSRLQKSIQDRVGEIDEKSQKLKTELSAPGGPEEIVNRMDKLTAEEKSKLSEQDKTKLADARNDVKNKNTSLIRLKAEKEELLQQLGEIDGYIKRVAEITKVLIVTMPPPGPDTGTGPGSSEAEKAGDELEAALRSVLSRGVETAKGPVQIVPPKGQGSEARVSPAESAAVSAVSRPAEVIPPIPPLAAIGLGEPSGKRRGFLSRWLGSIPEPAPGEPEKDADALRAEIAKLRAEMQQNFAQAASERGDLGERTDALQAQEDVLKGEVVRLGQQLRRLPEEQLVPLLEELLPLLDAAHEHKIVVVPDETTGEPAPVAPRAETADAEAQPAKMPAAAPAPKVGSTAPEGELDRMYRGFGTLGTGLPLKMPETAPPATEPKGPAAEEKQPSAPAAPTPPNFSGIRELPGGITEIWKNGIRVLVERPDGSVEVGGGSKGIMIGPDMLVARPVVPSRAPATPPVTAPKGPAASVPLPPTAAPEPAKAKTLLAGLPPTMQTMMKNAPGYNGSIAAYREKGSLTVSVALPDPEKSPEEFIHVLMELTALPTEWVEPLGAMALMHYRDPKIMPLPLTEDRALALVDAIVGKRVQMYNVRLTDADLKDVNSPLARVSKGELGIKVADALEDNIEKLIAYDSIVLEPLLGEAKLVADQLKSEKLGDRVSKLKLDTVEQRIRAGRLLGEVRSVRREVAARKPPAATPATSVAGAGALAPAVAPREAERPAPKQQAWIEAFEMPKDASPLNKEAWSSHLRKTEARVIIRYMVNSGQIGTREADLLIRYSNPEEDKRPRYLEVTAPLKRYLVAANSLIAANEALPDMTPYGAIEMPADLLSAGGGPPPALTETRSGKALLGDTRGELGPERPTVSLEDFARTGQLTPQTPPLLPPPIPQPAAPTQATAPKAPEARPLPVIPAAPPAPPVPLPAAATQEPTVSLVMDAPVKIIDASKSIALAPLPDILTREITTDYKAQHGFLEPGDALQLSAWLAAANTLTERDYMREFPIWLIERCNIDTAVGDDKFRATAEAGSIGELAKRSTRLTKFEDVMRLRALVRAAVKAGVIRIEQPVPPAREVGIDARLLAKVPLSLDYDGSDALRRWYNNNDNKEKLNRLGRDYRHLDDASKVLYEFVKTPWVMVSGRTAPTPILADEKVMRAFLSLAKTALEASGVLDFDETKELRETLGVLSRHGAPKSASAVTIEEGMVAVNEEQIAPPTGLVPAQRYYSEPEPKSKGPGLLARAKSWGSGLLGRKKKPAEEKPAESTPAKEYDEDDFTSEDNEGPSEENEGGGRMDGRGVMPLFPGVADDDLRLFGIRRKPPAVTVELRNR